MWPPLVSGPDAPVMDDRREAAAREVLASLASGEGLVALTGPAGVGKTAVLGLVAARLEGAGVRVLRVEGAAAPGGRLSLRALLAQVAGRDIAGMEEGAVEELLDLLDGTGAGVVVAVDDAQALQADAAEFFRLLAMLGRGQMRRSRVVFAGRPEFWDVFPDDPKGRARLVGARIVLPGDEEAAIPAPAAPAPAAMAMPARRRGRARGAVTGLAGLGLGLVALAAGWVALGPELVREAAVAVAAVPEEGPVAGAPAPVPVAAIIEVPVEAPVVGGVARRMVAEARVEAPAPGGVARRFLAERRMEGPQAGGVAPARVVEPPAEAAVAGRPAERVVAVAEDPALVAALMRRGAGLVALGDISAARLVFARAVAAGEAAAATALGRTFDPAFLAEIGGRGIAGDTAEAARWYRRGAEMGDAQAEAALRGLAGR